MQRDKEALAELMRQKQKKGTCTERESGSPASSDLCSHCLRQPTRRELLPIRNRHVPSTKDDSSVATWG